MSVRKLVDYPMYLIAIHFSDCGKIWISEIEFGSHLSSNHSIYIHELSDYRKFLRIRPSEIILAVYL